MLKTILSAFVGMRAATELKELSVRAFFSLIAAGLFILAVTFAAISAYHLLMLALHPAAAAGVVAGFVAIAAFVLAAPIFAYAHEETPEPSALGVLPSLASSAPAAIVEKENIKKAEEKVEEKVEEFAENLGPINFSLLAFMLGVVAAREMFAETPKDQGGARGRPDNLRRPPPPRASP